MERDRSEIVDEGGAFGRSAFRTIDVDVGFDEEAKVYYVLSSSLPGLNIETPTFEQFVEVALDAAPDLIGDKREDARSTFVAPCSAPCGTRIKCDDGPRT